MKQKKPIFVQFDSDFGKSILYETSKKINNINSVEVKLIIEEMKEKLVHGMGLAANQIGKSLQLFMIQFTDTQKTLNPQRFREMEPVAFQIFINPKIIKSSKDNMTFWHKCLSADGKDFGKVATYQWIEYEAQNENGNIIKDKLDKLGAIIFQHEFRHLLGGTYLEKAKEYKSNEELNMLIACGELKSYDRTDIDIPHLLDDYVIGETIEEYRVRHNK